MERLSREEVKDLEIVPQVGERLLKNNLKWKRIKT